MLGACRSATKVFLGDWHGELALPTPKLARTKAAAFQPVQRRNLNQKTRELCQNYSQEASSSWCNEIRTQAVALDLQGTA